MKIAIAVPGRFDAFDTAAALIDRGHDVTVFTNYPRWAAARWGLPAENVRSFTRHGGVARAANGLKLHIHDALLRWFGRWVAAALRESRYDLIESWSGISEELLSERDSPHELRFVVRASSHVRTQNDLLEAEEKRLGVRIERPSVEGMAREEREYEMATAVIVNSSFGRRTFIDRGYDSSRIIVRLGASRTGLFRPPAETIDARRKRIRDNSKLRVLFVGSISARKGMFDLLKVVREVGREFEFRLVGSVAKDARKLIPELEQLADVRSKVAEHELPAVYDWGDVFLFPTIEDGYPQVLAQAYASGLPIVTTENCSGPDMLTEGQTGWIVPARRSDLMIERLKRANEDRQLLDQVVQNVYETYQPRTHAEMVREYEDVVARFSSAAS